MIWDTSELDLSRLSNNNLRLKTRKRTNTRMKDKIELKSSGAEFILWKKNGVIFCHVYLCLDEMTFCRVYLCLDEMKCKWKTWLTKFGDGWLSFRYTPIHVQIFSSAQLLPTTLSRIPSAFFAALAIYQWYFEGKLLHKSWISRSLWMIDESENDNCEVEARWWVIPLQKWCVHDMMESTSVSQWIRNIPTTQLPPRTIRQLNDKDTDRTRINDHEKIWWIMNFLEGKGKFPNPICEDRGAFFPSEVKYELKPCKEKKTRMTQENQDWTRVTFQIYSKSENSLG